jgi:hypothetical protein
MQLFVKGLDNQTFMIVAEPSDSIADIKIKIKDLDGTPFDLQQLVCNGRQLYDENTVKDYNIRNQSTIHVVTRLRGGMMHSSSGRKNYEM